MLDFLLVLGQVPGTDVQITFNELVIGIILIAGWIFRRQLRRMVKRWSANLTSYWLKRSQQRRQLSLPV